MDSGTNQFPGENHSGNGSSGVGRNQICNLLPMTTNHVPSYNDPVHGSDYRSKGKAVVQYYLTVDVDESVNDESKLMMLVDDGLKSVNESFQYKVKKSTKHMVKLSEKHTCSNTHLRPYHRQANKKVLGHFLKGILADSIGNMLRWKQIQRTLNDQKKNPGTVTHIKTSDDNKFEYFFMAIGLRPIIDDAHLKRKYLGTMFLAVNIDGNKQIIPIAFGVGKTESGES
uniref:MULE transposase domain-containing protein n=1 Tax=Lactuca sativa TaxID=4236 RepID=A0A9R1XBT8_LACSA|nr:hypothetical protein LSAT_V11C500230870 [Lactuca sativa]